MKNFNLESIKALSKKKNNNAVKNFECVKQKIEDAANQGKRYCVYFCDEDTYEYSYNQLMNMGFNVDDLSSKIPCRNNPEFKTLGIDW